MQRIQKIFAKRIPIVLEIVKYTETYIDTIKIIVSSLNPTELASRMADITDVRDRSSELDFKITNVAELSAVFSTSEYIVSKLSNMIDIFNNNDYFQAALYRINTVVAQAAFSKKSAVYSLYDNLKASIVVEDDEIIEIFAGEKHNIDNLFNFVIKNTDSNRFTIWLIGYCIMNTTGERRRRVESIVENQKDILLDSKRLTSTAPGIQGVISRYGLAPIGESVTIKSLLEKFGLYTGKFSENWKKDLTRDGVGLIIINTSSDSPIEFNINGLINQEYVEKNDLKTTPISGLNKKIIRRYATSATLPKFGISAGRLEVYHGKSDQYRVIQTINGKLFRLLGKNGEEIIQKDSIRGLIDGIPTRAQIYNELQADTIINNCFNPKILGLINRYVDTKYNTQTPTEIKTKIQADLMKSFKTGLPDIKSVGDYKMAAINEQSISDALIKAYPPISSIHGLQLGEFTLTALAKIDSAGHKLKKELERNITTKSLTDYIFKYDKEELGRILTDTYQQLLDKTLGEMLAGGAWDDFVTPVSEYVARLKQ